MNRHTLALAMDHCNTEQETTDEHHCQNEEYEDEETARFRTFITPEYHAYIKRYGYHFTPALADHATHMMTNADGSTHHWTSEQVKNAMTSHGMELDGEYTWGDAAYQANMAYADFFPVVITNEMNCLHYADLTIHDPDGYDGLIFSRWLADMMQKGIEIDWEYYTRA